MKNGKKLNLYVSPHASLKVSWEKAKKKKLSRFFLFFYWVGLIVLFTGKFQFRLCMAIIREIARFFRFAGRLCRDEVFRTESLLRLRARKMTEKTFFQSVVTFCFLCLLVFGMFSGARVIAFGLKIKASVIRFGLSGKLNLEEAAKAAQGNDITGAQASLARAFQDFESGRQEMAEAGLIIDKIANLLPQKRAGERLLEAAGLLSRSGDSLLRFYTDSKNLSFSAQGLSGKNSVPQTLSSMQSSLAEAQDRIGQAKTLIGGVDEIDIPQSQRQMFLQLKNKVGLAYDSLENVSELFRVAASFCQGPRRILFVFQNNNERRPAGGFFGTFGDFEITNCQISKQRISSIYDLDGQLKEIIKPPFPILNVNERWYLRDSNWFADFPASARKISEFYEKDGGETPDMVIALDPSLLKSLLAITGPVDLDAFNAHLNSDNFVEQTQALTITDASLPTNEPKALLGAFFPVLLQKLFALSPDSAGTLLAALQNNLNAKHLMLYSRDSEIEKQLDAFHWIGSVSQTDRDYLQIVSANLSGSKTDLYIDESISVSSTVTTEGDVLDQVAITRTNRMPKDPSTKNLSFIRLLVPEGSELLTDLGFDKFDLPKSPDLQYKTDMEVAEWEKDSRQSLITGTVTGTEAGKTYFGNWQQLEGGETKTVTITYKLPFTLQNTDKHSMVIQKQPGTINQSLSYTLNTPGRSIIWNNLPDASLKEGRISVQKPLSKDYFFGVVLQK